MVWFYFSTSHTLTQQTSRQCLLSTNTVYDLSGYTLPPPPPPPPPRTLDLQSVTKVNSVIWWKHVTWLHIFASVMYSSISSFKLPTPWREILLSRPMWMNILAQWGNIWGLFTLTTQAPTYFKLIHGWDIRMVSNIWLVTYVTDC